MWKRWRGPWIFAVTYPFVVLLILAVLSEKYSLRLPTTDRPPSWTTISQPVLWFGIETHGECFEYIGCSSVSPSCFDIHRSQNTYFSLPSRTSDFSEPWAELRKGDVFFASGSRESAIQQWMFVVERFGYTDAAEAALARLAGYACKMGQRDKAILYYEQLVNRPTCGSKAKTILPGSHQFRYSAYTILSDLSLEDGDLQSAKAYAVLARENYPKSVLFGQVPVFHLANIRKRIDDLDRLMTAKTRVDYAHISWSPGYSEHVSVGFKDHLWILGAGNHEPDLLGGWGGVSGGVLGVRGRDKTPEYPVRVCR